MNTDQENSGYPSVDFKGDCGQSKTKSSPYSAESVGMQVNQTATVNGSPPSNCVVGNDSATVYSILLTKTAAPIYKYQVLVDCQGPKGVGSGFFHLAFTDETGDTYYLKIYSSKREQHTVDFNSKNPNIVKIWWSNYEFDVPSAKTTKADFRVTSPVHK